MPNDEKYDFMTHSGEGFVAKPLYTMPSNGESEAKKFERFSHQISRCVQACSLCAGGCSFVNDGNSQIDPHVVPSIKFSRIALVGYSPDVAYSKRKRSETFYETTIFKCIGCSLICPFFEIEMQALKPKLIIATDAMAGKYLTNIESMKFKKVILQYGLTTKTVMAETPELLKSALKLVQQALTDPQVGNRLFS